MDPAKYYPASYLSFSSLKKTVKINEGTRLPAYISPTRLAWINMLDITQNSRILDVGCGTGNIGEYLTDLFGCSYLGIELNKVAAAIARSRSLKIDHGTLDDFKHSEKFDIAILLHVIEHFQDPPYSLRQVSRLLRPNGTLVVGCPNVNALERRIFRKYWDGWDIPRHVYHFKPQTLRLLLSNAGFVVERLMYESYSVFSRSLANVFFVSAPYALRKERIKRKIPKISWCDKLLGILLAVLKTSGAVQITARRAF